MLNVNTTEITIVDETRVLETGEHVCACISYFCYFCNYILFLKVKSTHFSPFLLLHFIAHIFQSPFFCEIISK